jgi:peptidyl-prolyl cis-trans isomerase B (cyclophilin B)
MQKAKSGFLVILSAFLLVSAQTSWAVGRVFNKDYSQTKSITAEIKTHEGVMSLELFFQDAPNTVANFVHLVDSGFYNGLSFHRIIQGFMAQGGDPKGDGTGGPGWTIDNESNTRSHEAGTLSMANAGMDTGGSQFFLCHMPQTHLNGRHTVFGKLTTGFDVLTHLEKGDPILSIKVVEEKK